MEIQFDIISVSVMLMYLNILCCFFEVGITCNSEVTEMPNARAKRMYVCFRFVVILTCGQVGNLFYFIFYFIFCRFNQSVGKNYFLVYLAPNSLSCICICTLRSDFLFFAHFLTPPLSFS